MEKKYGRIVMKKQNKTTPKSRTVMTQMVLTLNFTSKEKAVDYMDNPKLWNALKASEAYSVRTVVDEFTDFRTLVDFLDEKKIKKNFYEEERTADE